LEEAKVIALVRAGEVDAFAGIIEHYQKPIIRYLLLIFGSLGKDSPHLPVASHADFSS